MSNVQITKQRKNATTDKLNVNTQPCSSAKKSKLEVVRSLSPRPPDDFEPSENEATSHLVNTRFHFLP